MGRNIFLIGLMLMTSICGYSQKLELWDAKGLSLVSRKLGPGVFGVFAETALQPPFNVPKPTSGGFIVGAKYILVIESFVDSNLTTQLLRLIRQESNLRIRYLVNTSYHGDHSFGNYLFPNETLIIQSAYSKSFLESAKNFETHRQNLSRNLGEDSLILNAKYRAPDILVNDSIAIDLGERVVVVRSFGFAQTPGDLYVWETTSKVLWTGNTIVAPDPAIPWLIGGRYKDVIKTMQSIKKFLPDDAIVIPGHFGPIKKNEIDFGINYLLQLETEIKDAKKRNLTLEESLKQITMKEYNKGYSIFDFVHYKLNVPAVYKEIMNEK